VEPKPRYFEPVHNANDNQTYWRYKQNYWEEDRKNQDWSQAYDIFSTEMPEEVRPFFPE
jgi:hypothetical protein